jgi:hypothetical protein
MKIIKINRFSNNFSHKRRSFHSQKILSTYNIYIEIHNKCIDKRTNPEGKVSYGLLSSESKT